uniref:Uncharacterized protein n=1 Tax=Homalodisca liturata TaxID=320908 RepID=A0A1B6JHI9_9HEMI
MWSIILLSSMSVLSSAQETNNITHKTQVLQEYQNEYNSIIDNIGSYISDKLINSCKNTTASLEEKEETCDQNCIRTIRRCLQSAANMTVDDLPDEIKSEVARLVLFKVVYIVSKLGQENESNETVAGEKELMDAAAHRIDEDIRKSVNATLTKKGFLDDLDKIFIEKTDKKTTKPRWFPFTCLYTSYKISRFVYKAGYPMLKKLLKGGVGHAKKQLSKKNIKDTLDSNARGYGQDKLTSRDDEEEEVDMSEEIKGLLLDILKDLTGVGILFDLLDLSRSLIDQE